MIDMDPASKQMFFKDKPPLFQVSGGLFKILSAAARGNLSFPFFAKTFFLRSFPTVKKGTNYNARNYTALLFFVGVC